MFISSQKRTSKNPLSNHHFSYHCWWMVLVYLICIYPVVIMVHRGRFAATKKQKQTSYNCVMLKVKHHLDLGEERYTYLTWTHWSDLAISQMHLFHTLLVCCLQVGLPCRPILVFLHDYRSGFLFVYADRGLPISPALSTLLSPQTPSLSQWDSPSMC